MSPIGYEGGVRKQLPFFLGGEEAPVEQLLAQPLVDAVRPVERIPFARAQNLDVGACLARLQMWGELPRDRGNDSASDERLLAAIDVHGAFQHDRTRGELDMFDPGIR